MGGNQPAWVYGTFQYIAQRRVRPGATDNGTLEPRNDKGRIVDLYGTETEVLCDTVGQFTGLHDINGKDIYEGDILDVNYADEESYLEVRFVRGVFAFLWDGDLDDEFPCNAPTHEWAKVIGNIHDDPKLLKRH
jgi:hypothetical protein